MDTHACTFSTGPGPNILPGGPITTLFKLFCNLSGLYAVGTGHCKNAELDQLYRPISVYIATMKEFSLSVLAISIICCIRNKLCCAELHV